MEAFFALLVLSLCMVFGPLLLLFIVDAIIGE